jgi:hypothetical protein
MEIPKTDHVVKAAKEIGESFKETADLVSGMSGALNEASQLYDHGCGGAGKSLISLGIAMVVFPEPFMVSDVLGGGLIAAGLLYNKIVPPPIYIDNIFETIQGQVKTLNSTGENLSRDFSVPVDFSSMRFEF